MILQDFWISAGAVFAEVEVLFSLLMVMLSPALTVLPDPASMSALTSACESNLVTEKWPQQKVLIPESFHDT